MNGKRPSGELHHGQVFLRGHRSVSARSGSRTAGRRRARSAGTGQPRRASACRSGKRIRAWNPRARTAPLRASTFRPPVIPTSGSPTSGSTSKKPSREDAGREREGCARGPSAGVERQPGSDWSSAPEAQLNASACPEESQVGVDEAVGTAEFVAASGRPKLKNPGLQHVRHPGEPARFRGEIKIPAVAPVWRTFAAISKAASAGTTKRKRLKAAGSHGRLPRVLQDHEFPEDAETGRVEADLLGRAAGTCARERRHAHGLPDAPEHLLEQAVTYLHVELLPGTRELSQTYANETPLATAGCGFAGVSPTGVSLEPETAQFRSARRSQGRPHVPLSTATPSQPNSPNVSGAQVTLPEGMTLNPRRPRTRKLHNAQIGLAPQRLACPAASQLGRSSARALNLREFPR